MTRSMTITIRGKNVAFESRHSDQDVIRRMGDLIASRKVSNSFAIDVYSKRDRGLSFRQLLWLHFLVSEADGAIEEETVAENLFHVVRIVAMLETARRSGIQWPVLHAQTETDRLIRMSLTGSSSQEPGSVSITNGDREMFYGTIRRNGSVVKGKLPADIESCLLMICEDPIKFARLYGQRTSKCCFGNHRLTNKNSIALGYGPVCAEKWGLYHSYEKGAVEGTDDHAKPSDILRAASDPDHQKAIEDGRKKAKTAMERAGNRDRKAKTRLSSIDDALQGVDSNPIVPPYMMPDGL